MGELVPDLGLGLFDGVCELVLQLAHFLGLHCTCQEAHNHQHVAQAEHDPHQHHEPVGVRDPRVVLGRTCKQGDLYMNQPRRSNWRRQPYIIGRDIAGGSRG